MDRQPWRAGFFFYDPDNPRIWVRKRLGIGWTLNFARRGAWATLAGLIAAIVIVAVVAARLGS